jgi:23S rRNA U2552 (ribose-2'-O)-methylase RlmE/FtsJ
MKKIYERDIRNVRPMQGMEISSKVEEINEIYPIRTSNKISDLKFPMSVEYSPLITEDRMLTGIFSKPATVKSLWIQKDRLDPYFKQVTTYDQFGMPISKNKAEIYYRARNTIFPQDQKGSSRFRNRAGDKLFEVHEAVGLFPLKGGAFFDLAGGPGAWSEVLLKGNNWVGYGMTLQLPNTPREKIWYKHLYKDYRWKDLWGSDNTGNMYSVDNINDATNLIRTTYKDGVDLAMGDGGIHIEKDEHLQELYNTRLIIGELLAALKSLKVGGYFCCKLFDTFSPLTASIVYIVALSFNECFIVKPIRSRIVNSERYVVGHRYNGPNHMLISHLENIMRAWDDNNSPVSLIPMNVMTEDKEFMETFSKQVNDLLVKQTTALRQVMDLADTLS